MDGSGSVTIVGVGDGSATITATAATSNEYASVNESYTLSVSPKALTVTADDAGATYGTAHTVGAGETAFAASAKSMEFPNAAIAFGTGPLKALKSFLK